MRAAVLETPGEPLVIRDDVEIDDPHAGEVAVRITHCGVCHSDLSVADGSFPAPLPIVLGHEAAGVVEALGPGVTSLAVGDHVVLTPCPPCGVCVWCVRDEWSLCVNSDSIASSTHPDGGTRLSRNGETLYRGLAVAAFAETVVIQEQGAVKIPDDVPLEVACVVGCAVQTGVGAVINTAGVQEGETVLIMGAGGVGLSIVQGAKLANASRIIVSDPVADRRARATAMGATHVIDPTTDDVIAAAHDLTNGGIGVDYAFDAVGSSTLIAAGIDATRKGGSTVMVGAAPVDDPLVYPLPALMTIMGKNLLGCCVGSCNSVRDIPRLVALGQSGQLDLSALVTSHRPLADINGAFDDLRTATGVRTVIEL